MLSKARSASVPTRGSSSNPGIGFVEIRHYRDDLCTGDDLEERFDDQTRLFSCTVQIRVVETSHGGSTFADR